MFLLDKYYEKYVPYFQKNIDEIVSSFSVYDENTIMKSNDHDKI